MNLAPRPQLPDSHGHHPLEAAFALDHAFACHFSTTNNWPVLFRMAHFSVCLRDTRTLVWRLTTQSVESSSVPEIQAACDWIDDLDDSGILRGTSWSPPIFAARRRRTCAYEYIDQDAGVLRIGGMPDDFEHTLAPGLVS